MKQFELRAGRATSRRVYVRIDGERVERFESVELAADFLSAEAGPDLGRAIGVVKDVFGSIR